MTLQRYLTRLIAITVLPVLALAMALSWLQFAQERDNDGIEALRLAEQLAREVDLALDARIKGLQTLARSPLLDAPRLDALHAQARGFHDHFGGHVLLVDDERRIRLHSAVPPGDALPELVTPPGRAAVPLTFASAGPNVGDPFFGPIAQELLVAVVVPVRREARVPLVLVNAMPVRELNALLDGLPLPPGWSASVHDSRGGLFLQGGTPGGSAPARGNGAATLRFAGRPLAVPWTVEVRIPQVTYVQHLANLGALLAAALLGVLGVSLLAARWGTRRLSASVRSLVEAAPPQAPVEPIDEIRESRRLLDRAFAEREAAARALQAREEQLRRTFESASEVIVTVDAHQQVLLANPAAARVFGRPVEQIVGAPLSALIPERLRAAHAEHVLQFGRTKQGPRPMAARRDVRGLRADGSEFPAEAAISQVQVGGEPLYTVVLHDVTERRQAEAAAAAATARLQAALQSMRDALVMIDTEQRIVEVNPAFLRMYGLASRDECPRSLREFERFLEVRLPDGQLVPPEDWSKSRALRGDSGSDVECRLLRKDTGRSWMGSFSFGPIRDTAGRLLGAVVTVRDVTERLRLEGELRASHADLARLVVAQQTVQEEERKRIARELHDELQQVLAAIKMDVSAIDSQLALDPAGLPPLLAHVDELASAAIMSSRRIVNDLRPLLLEELGLAAALEALARQFSERTGIEAQVDCDEQAAAAGAVGDATAICLFRVAQEALNNVAKHARASRVQIGLGAAAGGGWRLVVSDDGGGMRPADRHKPASFGLRGMAERVRALGGTLSVQGPPGQGVTLEVRVPGASAAATAPG
jgi:PAS domain S-box-containing protein